MDLAGKWPGYSRIGLRIRVIANWLGGLACSLGQGVDGGWPSSSVNRWNPQRSRARFIVGRHYGSPHPNYVLAIASPKETTVRHLALLAAFAVIVSPAFAKSSTT